MDIIQFIFNLLIRYLDFILKRKNFEKKKK